MPTYEFRCTECEKLFLLTETFKEHARHDEKCPKCGSKHIEQQPSNIQVKTSKKS